jgi:hypothetical protein
VPQFSAVFAGWDLGARTADFAFDFAPPIDADEIEILPVVTTTEVTK